jgi:hypothetical protein
MLVHRIGTTIIMIKNAQAQRIVKSLFGKQKMTKRRSLESELMN